MRDGGHGIERGAFAVPAFKVGHVVPGHPPLLNGFHPAVLVRIERDADDIEALVLVLLVERHDVGHLGLAGAAPGGPEIHEDAFPLAGIVRQVHRIAVGILEGDIDKRLPDSRLLQPLNASDNGLVVLQFLRTAFCAGDQFLLFLQRAGHHSGIIEFLPGAGIVDIFLDELEIEIFHLLADFVHFGLDSGTLLGRKRTCRILFPKCQESVAERFAGRFVLLHKIIGRRAGDARLAVHAGYYGDFRPRFQDDRRVGGRSPASILADVERAIIRFRHFSGESILSVRDIGRIHRHLLRGIGDQVGDAEARNLINDGAFQRRIFDRSVDPVSVPAAGGNKQGGPQGRRCK